MHACSYDYLMLAVVAMKVGVCIYAGKCQQHTINILIAWLRSGPFDLHAI